MRGILVNHLGTLLARKSNIFRIRNIICCRSLLSKGKSWIPLVSCCIPWLKLALYLGSVWGREMQYIRGPWLIDAALKIRRLIIWLVAYVCRRKAPAKVASARRQDILCRIVEKLERSWNHSSSLTIHLKMILSWNFLEAVRHTN